MTHDEEQDDCTQAPYERMGDIPFYLMAVLMALVVIAIYGFAAKFIIIWLNSAFL